MTEKEIVKLAEKAYHGGKLGTGLMVGGGMAGVAGGAAWVFGTGLLATLGKVGVLAAAPVGLIGGYTISLLQARKAGKQIANLTNPEMEAWIDHYADIIAQENNISFTEAKAMATETAMKLMIKQMGGKKVSIEQMVGTPIGTVSVATTPTTEVIAPNIPATAK